MADDEEKNQAQQPMFKREKDLLQANNFDDLCEAGNLDKGKTLCVFFDAKPDGVEVPDEQALILPNTVEPRRQDDATATLWEAVGKGQNVLINIDPKGTGNTTYDNHLRMLEQFMSLGDKERQEVLAGKQGLNIKSFGEDIQVLRGDDGADALYIQDALNAYERGLAAAKAAREAAEKEEEDKSELGAKASDDISLHSLLKSGYSEKVDEALKECKFTHADKSEGDKKRWQCVSSEDSALKFEVSKDKVSAPNTQSLTDEQRQVLARAMLKALAAGLPEGDESLDKRIFTIKSTDPKMEEAIKKELKANSSEYQLFTSKAELDDYRADVAAKKATSLSPADPKATKNEDEDEDKSASVSMGAGGGN